MNHRSQNVFIVVGIYFVMTLIFVTPTIVTANGWYGYETWTPEWFPERNDLLCDKTCRTDNTGESFVRAGYDSCCVCRSKTTWQYMEINLFIEYVSVLGKSLVLWQSPFEQKHVYKIKHPHNLDLNDPPSEMTEIPSNICNWDKDERLISSFNDTFNKFKMFWNKIVLIDFSHNKIGKLGDLNCLNTLDTLVLKHNKLTHLFNTSISTLTYLRNVDVSYNQIKTIDTGVIASPLLSVQQFDIGYNQLTSFDVSNLNSQKPFCKMIFSNNKVTGFTNVLGFKVNLSASYGPGMVVSENNNFQKWPDFKELLGLSSIQQLGIFYHYGFAFKGSNFSCDCNMAPFMSLMNHTIETIWLDYMNMTCTAPEALVGTPVLRVSPDQLTCALKDDPHCKPPCKCTDKPADHTLYVDCSNAGLKQLPTKLPISNFSKSIHLNVSFNSIKRLTNVSYLRKVSVLDISYNDLKQFDQTAADALENATIINFSFNPNLHYFPPKLQYQNMCDIYTENLIIKCDCDSEWIPRWLSLNVEHCVNNSLFHCHLPDGQIVEALEFAVAALHCLLENFLLIITASLASVLLIMIIAATLVFHFKYEILVTLLRFRQQHKNAITGLSLYDVFISYDDENENLCKWVDSKLLPKLEASAYKVFLTYRDLPFGDVRDLSTISAIKNSQNFLLILSESYLSQEDRSWSENEWKYGWNCFKTDRTKNIVVINYDHISSFDIDEPRIRAFLRVGNPIEFFNRERDIIQKVSIKLGTPIWNLTRKENNLDNKKPKFVPYELFQVQSNDINKHSNIINVKNEDDVNFAKQSKVIHILDAPLYDDRVLRNRQHEGKHTNPTFHSKDANECETGSMYSRTISFSSNDSGFSESRSESSSVDKIVLNESDDRLIRERQRPAKGFFNYYV